MRLTWWFAIPLAGALAGCALPDLLEACEDEPLLPACFGDGPVDHEGDLGKADAVVSGSFVWPNGDVYIIIDDLGPLSLRYLDWLADRLAEETPIRLHLIGSPDDSPSGQSVTLQGRLPGGGGGAYVGAIGHHTVAESSIDALPHELGHIFGLSHTHQRVDRDEHVVIHWPYITERWRHNVEKVKPHHPHIGPYDVDSIMHYPSAPLGHLACGGVSRRLFDEREDRCVLPLRSGYLMGSWIYSALDYARLSVLYCDPRFCAEGLCAPAERCEAARVQANMDLIYQWEDSNEGLAWRERYPQAAR